MLGRSDQLNGDFYNGLIPLTKTMKTTERRLCASIIFGAVLDSILRRARPKTYFHGVRYPKRLDRLAESISDWRKFENRTNYLETLRLKHGRKSSFCSRHES